MPTFSALTLALPLLLAGLTLLLWWRGPRRWDVETNALRVRLLRHAGRRSGVFTQADLQDLPLPVVRYLRAALPDGQPLASHVRITWAGSFNMGTPGADKWAPFTAVQDIVPGMPGFVWDARIRMAPGLSVRVRDALVDGEGSMRAAAMGLMTIVDKASRSEMARASLQRYLAEATWFPTALLPSQGVRWTGIDETTALATLEGGAVSASVEFRFDADGRPASVFVPDRLYDDGKSPPVARPWQGRHISFAQRQGVLVPDRSTVEWLLPGGAYVYWQGHPVDISHE